MMLPVVILAGGLAKRMRPMTETIPKALLSVVDRPFIDWQLEILRSGGIERVVLCVGYLGEQLERHINDHKYGMDIRFSYDGSVPLGTGGAVKKAIPLVGEAFFVLYGDSYLEIDYADVEYVWRTSGKTALMTVFDNDNQWDTSNVLFGSGRIVCYSKTDRASGMRHIDYGLGILTADVFNNYGEFFDLAALYSDLANKNKLAGYEAVNRFYEIGSFSGLKELEERLGQNK